MLSLSNVGNCEAAAEYYEAADDYYTGDRSPSNWWGCSAAILGLSGPVDANVFAALLDGRLLTGEILHHAAAGRRGGTDATFSAPKSVSLQALVGGDMRLLGAHQRAVDRALVYAETLAACRVTEDGQTRSIPTGNLVVARFEHDLSRACDPHLHTHTVILNVTSRADGQWRALNNEALYRHKMLLGTLYRAELAREVQALGYETRVTHADGRFELAHISEDQVLAFSQRSAAIEAHLERQGQARNEASAWAKKIAAVATRDRKTAVDRDQLRQEWQTLSEEHGIDFTSPVGHGRPVATRDDVQAVLVQVVEHLGEREAVFSRMELLRSTLEQGVGTLTIDELKAGLEEARQSGLLIASGKDYTTAAAQAREAEILSIEESGRDSLSPVYDGDRMALEAQLGSLGEEQKQAALGVLLTYHQVMGIQGRAGVGKTTLLAATTTIAKNCGYTVLGLAPSASAARELASTGIQSETIATFMRRKYKGLDAKTVLVVDESGMTSTTQMLAILRAAQEAHCRVVMVGDTSQLAAVEAGKPFAQLQANGMATALVGQIRRQRNAVLRQAVEHAVDGKVALAVELLKKETTHIVSTAERHDRIATDYTTLTPEERAQTRVIAGTRHARRELNRRIRERLGLEGGQDFTLLVRKDLTEAARRSTLNYDAGDVLQAEVDYTALGFKRGELAHVVARLDHRILIERTDGSRVAWQPATMSRISVFVPETRPLAEGDLVRVTANDRGRGLVNGDLGRIVALDPESRRLTMELPDGRHVWLDGTQPLMLDYGYCSTVHSAQGQTCERVMIEADANSLTANRATFYVAISRARESAMIYTDDREMLPLAMARELTKASALDVQHEACLE
ncbi:MobF family relaxase [Denitratisoma oestradiolicum]|uniref:IncW plasmid conjugative relaxase protein TrwC (TraI homolog) n=1 Tax=Denitratisoma oestradiolicum TaxID=311182 RepID=A0A6S6Y287_9PROT|nr:MobF family relaxase [Denitratisoma oestradiolicum]TWO80238.1 hypothetical protein CBW56_10515 [Denitratisoma oestradiolicum]CAB1369326.1 IncW plasmid conjugative relaxase protein TrwC (TraI homolog) [Denitratisoma oestradiolicum]